MYYHDKQKKSVKSLMPRVSFCMDHFSLGDMIIELLSGIKWMNEGGQNSIFIISGDDPVVGNVPLLFTSY